MLILRQLLKDITCSIYKNVSQRKMLIRKIGIFWKKLKIFIYLLPGSIWNRNKEYYKKWLNCFNLRDYFEKSRKGCCRINLTSFCQLYPWTYYLQFYLNSFFPEKLISPFISYRGKLWTKISSKFQPGT